VLADDRAASELESAPRPCTLLRAKLRRYIEKVGIAEARRTTGLTRSTLLSLRTGLLSDPKASQIRALAVAGITLDDVFTLIPALQSSGT
jgi:hypothetical protein